ncbi:MAG: hypothetical protein ACUVXI_01835 [bacterium]
MVLYKCPGQNTQFWGPEDIFNLPCPNCGEALEFFKDDVRRKCPQCGREVYNPRIDASCALWCPQAAECIGPERYKNIMDIKRATERRKGDMERLLSIIGEGDDDVKALFKRLYIENKDYTKLFDTSRLNEIRERDPDLFARATGYFSKFNSSR